MKHVKHGTLLLTLIVLLASSCKKDGYNYPNSKCLLSHYEDELNGAVDIFYNQRGNPDSVSFNGFGNKLEYDNSGRLVKQKFSTGYFEFVYNNNSFLPTTRRFWSTQITTPAPAGLVEIDSLQYNILGQLIKKGITNRIAPAYNLFQKYEYNNRGNVTKVTTAAQNGGTVFLTPVVSFEGSRYDTKLNIFVTNQWLKYLFDNTEFSDYTYSMFSINNAADFKWGYTGGYIASVTSTIVYNTQGFANNFACRYIGTDGTDINFTRIGRSTCDAAPANRMAIQPANKAGNLPLIKNNKYGLPIITQQP